jgi:molybdenum cofactor biosynthesis enzyme MoaA
VSFMEMVDLVEAEVAKVVSLDNNNNSNNNSVFVENNQGKKSEKLSSSLSLEPEKKSTIHKTTRPRKPLLEPVMGAKCGDVAKVYKLPASMHPQGRIGFITSMTSQFCGTCNRIRLTADGHLKVCLFDANEVSLRDPLRAGATDEELTQIIENAIKKKHPSLGGKASPEEIAQSANRHMSSIGG